MDWHPFSPELENGIPQIRRCRTRSAWRVLTVPDVTLVGRTNRYAGSKPGTVRCFVVNHPDVDEYVCRTQGYAAYLSAGLDEGLYKEDLKTESQWLVASGRKLTRYPSRYVGGPTSFVCAGLCVKSFLDPSAADGWHQWYENRRHVMGLDVRGESDDAQYLKLRSQETLDKPMEERVYELVKRLTTDPQRPDDVEDLN